MRLQQAKRWSWFFNLETPSDHLKMGTILVPSRIQEDGIFTYIFWLIGVVYNV